MSDWSLLREVEPRRRARELRLDSIEVRARGGVGLVEGEHLQERLARRREVAGLERLAASLQALDDAPVALRHLLPRPLDAADGLGVVDVDQEDPGPDLDRLLAVARTRGLVAPAEQGIDLLLLGRRLGCGGRREGRAAE